jgi:hypothetical protein
MKVHLYDAGIIECPFPCFCLSQSHNIAAAITYAMSSGFHSSCASSMHSLNLILHSLLSKLRHVLASNSWDFGKIRRANVRNSVWDRKIV